MKTKNDFNKYGLITMIGWNILLIVLILIVSTIKGFPFTYIFDDDTGGIGMSIFLLIWSFIWYGIGYKSRKDYVLTRNMICIGNKSHRWNKISSTMHFVPITLRNKPSFCR